jgi:F-type H+-transporting ATPase subunit delta
VKSRAGIRPYAKALFSLAKERSETEAVGRDLDTVASVVAGDADLRGFLQLPWVTAARKRAVAAEVAGRLEVSKLVQDFAALVAGRGRGEDFAAIAQAYRDLLDEDLGRVRARVRTAVALTEAERTALAARLGRALGGRQVVLDEVVDRDLLGGFIAESGSVIVDGSLDGQLARLRHRLATA